ncbi:acyl carrier protein [Nitrosomonas eutropha]|uniref:Acyl carrier protein n=3 Tax=Nitrosomonadaceae TaxID=206379 RepID=A0ABX5M6M1_9PROT|nr:acyl carrier protein [Nitrosomonas eutropha]ABI58737.1 phosphopantetheine-binding protein [Nitrosomonas eutropha C91]PXV80693.1 acyl carrier protein [Nitrosomonas eutropha]SCX02605.1 acyl carrier protein [Nitrosomonas eutropha]SEI40878.1 acyl carrier protein [Nitrosomonas eutropha]
MSKITQTQITGLLCQRLACFTDVEAEISPETNLITHLAIDSVKLLNLIMEIEDQFDISVPLNALVDVLTVQDLANLIYKIKSSS